MKKHSFVILLFFIVVFGIFSCKKENTNIVVSAVDSDFDEEKQTSPILAEGFTMTLWAPGPLVANAVAISFDETGAAYVAETSRRKSSDLDIREHRNWMFEDIGLQSIEETRDFHLKKLATNLSDKNLWLEDHNKDGIHDYRDLEVQSEYIRKIWDSDGDGRADKSELFAEDFNSMLTGVAAGILYYNDEVYLTAAPDVWRLKDTNHDGVADERTKISYGYGIHIAYAGHDMSGLTIGNDGKIYWSIGDMGVNSVGPDGKRWKYPNEGAVMRCNPDGSEFEVFAHGLRNPQEIDFDDFGNLISVDNDGDHQGEHERYVHIIQGSDSGWRTQWQFGKYDLPNESYKIWMDEKLHIPHFKGQAAYLLPPIALAYDGPAGLAYNPGTALSEKWKGYFFASYFTGSSARSKVQAFKLVPNGASFSVSEIVDVLGGIVPTGINFANDGALYINDWKDSYDKKPTGRIWKFDVENELKNKNRAETQKILSVGVSKLSIEDLKKCLSNEDKRVRLAAQFELVKRKELESLVEVAMNEKNLLARLHAIWGIGQLGRVNNEILSKVLPLLSDDEEQVRAQTAKVIGDAKYQLAIDFLITQSNDKSAQARFFAIEALGKLGDKKAYASLVKELEKIGDNDPHMRHAIVFALSQLNQENEIASLSNHASTDVRLGAVVALRMIKSPKVALFLSDVDPLVRLEAARAIHDDESIPEALIDLAKTLNSKSSNEEAYIRRAINANLRIGDTASAERLGEFILSTSSTIEMRKDALWALGYWEKPLELDRVDGRVRKFEGHALSDAQKVIIKIYPQLIDTKNEGLKSSIIICIGRLKCTEVSDKIFAIFQNKNNSIETRRAALETLSMLKGQNLIPAIDMALEDKNLEMRQLAQDCLASAKIPDEVLVRMIDKILEKNSIQEKQLALASLSKINSPEAEKLLESWFKKLNTGSIASELELDLAMAIDSSDFDNLKKAKLEFEKSIDTSDVVAMFASTLNGGNADKGLRIFGRNESAQCLRCHVYKGYGGSVGPELTSIADKLSKDDLLKALVDPNSRIAPGFGSIIITLNNGEQLSGTLQNENGENISFISGNNPVQTIEKSQIKEVQYLPSGMFNMSEVLNKAQLRDLMAFLVTLKE